jgi:hypothetical protein
MSAQARELQRIHEVPLGVLLPPIIGEDLEGKPRQVTSLASLHGMLLFVFSEHCGPSNANWVNWHELLQTATATGLSPLFIDLGGSLSSGFIERHQLNHRVVLTNISPETRLFYHLDSTPQTILVNPQGRAVYVWTGFLKGSIMTGVLRLTQLSVKSGN